MFRIRDTAGFSQIFTLKTFPEKLKFVWVKARAEILIINALLTISKFCILKIEKESAMLDCITILST
jgi:hypothetical protein